jgi:hypothetical protein
MPTVLKSFVTGIPKWVWGIVLVYALLEPVTHLWLSSGSHGDNAFSGIHNPDSAVFLHAMRMFETDFFSPYASSEAESPHSYRYFPIPFFWMYAVIGEIGGLLHIPEFVMLGLANGLGMGLYLLVIFKLMQAIWPKQANRAFLLFSLGGGLGGILYLFAHFSGSVNDPEFQQNFFRVAFYELLEGPRMAPWLFVSRLYYTLPLAFVFGAILAVVHWLKNQDQKWTYIAVTLIMLGSLLNVRFGLIAWGVIMLALFTHRHISLNQRLVFSACVSTGVGISTAITPWMLTWNPVFSENVLLLIRRSMWFMPFITVAFFHVLLLPKIVLDYRSRLKGWDAVWFHAAWGYILAFAGFYVVYHLYYGQLWPTADFTAAVRISDPSLVGAFVGGVWGWRKRRSVNDSESDATQAWVILWFGLFLVLAISAWGQGWFIRMGPQRVMLFLGPPLCLLTARSLDDIQLKRPRVAAMYSGVMVTCGVVSIAVATLAFQGPLGYHPGKSAFHEYHSEVMSKADEECLAHLGSGRVIAPTSLPSFGDIISIRGNSVLYGMAALEFSDRLYVEIARTVDTFYSKESTDAERQSIADEWDIDWVYCPDTSPIDSRVLTELKDADWLEVVSESGQAVLLKRI